MNQSVFSVENSQNYQFIRDIFVMDEYPLQNYRSEPSPMNLTQTQLSQMRPDAHQQIHNLTYGQELRENVGASRDTHKVPIVTF